jgi:hypothetical protein
MAPSDMRVTDELLGDLARVLSLPIEQDDVAGVRDLLNDQLERAVAKAVEEPATRFEAAWDER